MGASKIAEGSSTSRSFLPSRSSTSTFIVTLLRFLQQELLLASLFDDDQAAFSAGDRTMHPKQIALRIHQHHFQCLSGDAVIAHMTGTARILEHATWSSTRAVRTGCAL